MQPTAGELIAAYHRDGPLLFLGAAFITVAVVAAGFSLVRRRFDPLLIFLAMFAYLYGQRLRFQSEMLSLTTAHSVFFLDIRAAINYLVPIPAFAFFEAAGFLGRWGKHLVIIISLFFLSLVAGVFLFGPLHSFDLANAIAVVFLVPALVVRSQLMRERDKDFNAVRLGVICFVGGSLWDNIAGIFIRPRPIEPYCFAVFLATLGYVAARRMQRRDGELAEVRSELELARRIQLSLLPAAFPESPHFHVAARYLPMSSVAGDLYDYLQIEPNTVPGKLGILIADVSGHGVPAALIASMVKMAASAQNSEAETPAELLTGMNRALSGNTQDQFVTAAYLYLDAQARSLHYAAAGHPAMLLVRAGQVEEIAANGFPLGIVRDMRYDGIHVPIEIRDRMILYTDGLLEARNASGQLFGEANLHRLAAETATLNVEDAANRIMEAVAGWSHAQEDDLTVIVCDYLGDASSGS
ncbi:MAG TPA: PP2C family protein-serine/threonine phosphatase [Acidobacteriaceae bacterium]